MFDEMRHFFMVYKQLVNKETAVDYAADRDEAVKIIQKCLKCYHDNLFEILNRK